MFGKTVKDNKNTYTLIKKFLLTSIFEVLIYLYIVDN